ncbi:MAG TPA: HlyD family secretion protein [Arenimonas sp.]|uniref:HlyD family secretion protein n=1 Tax=Arenimonas sp. TaxID=1872635 RepID=UPI002C4A6690|nr:HlyD family secretion protein [Arenimonas sp.]HMB57907.1 HlyD family secretion protein [Arenimonas sp.]
MTTELKPAARINEAQPAARRRVPRWLWIAGPLLVLALFAWEFVISSRSVETDNAYVKADRVMISSQVSGRVIEVLVGQNEAVKKGQLLYRIDPAPLKIALAEAEARLAKVADSAGASRAGIRESDAALRSADATLGWAQQEFARQQQLLARGLVAQKALDDARHALSEAQAQRDSMVAAQDKARATLGGKPGSALEQLPDYQEALAVRDQARLDLAHVDVVAPVSGIIGGHDLQAGEYLNVGQVAMPLVATDPVWIEANFKETDLAHLRVGQAATIRVDSYPGVRWRALVASISPASGSEFSVLPAQNATGNWVKVVQRIPVKFQLIDIAADAPVLRAGMSADVKVDLVTAPQPAHTASL